MSGNVLAIPSSNTNDGLWGYPDLALIAVEDPPVGHPWVRLDEVPLPHAAELYAVGYNTIFAPRPALSPALLTYVGPQQFDTGNLLKVKNDELASGMSGGPVLDLSRGGVCGVIKTSRMEDSDYGGLVIPADAIVKHFPELAKIGPGSELDSWSKLRTALRHSLAPRELLAPDEESQLISTIAMMQATLYALFRLAVGELRAGPQEPLRDGADLVREVADSMLPTSGESHPLVRLCSVLADRSDGTEADGLSELADKIAQRLGEERHPIRMNQDDNVLSSSAIEIHLTPYGQNSSRYLLAIWRHGNVREHSAQIFCDDTPLTLRDIRSQLRVVLPRALAELRDADDLTIEFTLPRRLLHKSVDEWDLGTKEVSLGSQFPVIVRVADRPPETRWHWQKRWNSFRSHDGDHEDVLTWVDCHTEGVFRKLYGCFQLDEKLAVLAVSYQPGSDVLKAMMHAGIPIALWPRHVCKEHVEGASCVGDLFRDSLRKDISQLPLQELPALVKILRTKAISEDDSHYGRGITLLWDDPTWKRPDECVALGAPG